MTETIRAVERALDVLLCFTKNTPQLTMTQISEKVGINKSTVHRLLATLEHRRFVERDLSTGLYKLSISALQMAYLTLEANDLRRLAAPFMDQLCQEYGETVNLSVIDEANVVYLGVKESPQRVKLAASIGQRLPAFSTASGKAILAYLPSEEIKRILDYGMPRYTQNTITTSEEIIKNLENVKEQGYAISTQEYEEGINAIAAPIFDPDSYPIGSISIAGPTYRLSKERMIEISPTVISIVQEISREVNIVDNPDLYK